MRRVALLTLSLFAFSCPAMAKPHHSHSYHHHHHHHPNHTAARTSEPADHNTTHANRSGITCEMVREYVAKVGMSQAMAMAKSAGITAADEERARQCLAKKI